MIIISIIINIKITITTTSTSTTTTTSISITSTTITTTITTTARFKFPQLLFVKGYGELGLHCEPLSILISCMNDCSSELGWLCELLSDF